MEIPKTILDILKCSSCELYLSRGPVYLQHDGAAVCGRCFSPKRPATRNTQYEATAKLLKFPCKYRELGCHVTVPFAEEKEDIAHEVLCEHREYVCPVLGSASCDWLGPRSAMLAHCRDQHADRVLENSCSFTHDISRASLQNYIINAFRLLFLLHTKVCVTTGRIYHAIRLLGASAEAANFLFTLEIKRKNEQLSKEGQVAPQGCLAIQEDTALTLDTNSLVSILGGFDGTTLTVTVKRKVKDATDPPVKHLTWASTVKNENTCTRCKTQVTKYCYRDERGWRCERCAPARRACTLHSCTHTDINKKCESHELYFCQQVILCGLCTTFMSRGSLSSHYSTAHITYCAGSTWRAKMTSIFENWQFCLVTGTECTAVCPYRLWGGTACELELYTSLSSERLHEFKCAVRLTNPSTGRTWTYTPDALYDAVYDWHIITKNEEFESFFNELDVIIQINKKR